MEPDNDRREGPNNAEITSGSCNICASQSVVTVSSSVRAGEHTHEKPIALNAADAMSPRIPEPQRKRIGRLQQSRATAARRQQRHTPTATETKGIGKSSRIIPGKEELAG